MILILLGILLGILFFMAIRTDLLEDEILLYYDEEEEGLLDDEDEEG